MKTVKKEMQFSKYRIHTIKEVISKKCEDCSEPKCCKKFFVPLTPHEYKSGKYKIDKKRKEKGFIQLATKENSNECIYLKNDKCSIWNNRPEVCREYHCYNDERV